MKSLWDDKEASQFKDELGLRVYTSRLLGRDKSLVLHGGGNTSVKITEDNILGEQEELLYVKGSGWDLEKIDRPGFSPVRMQHLLALAKLERLSDPQMVNELKTQLTIASAPTPSVEAILHAILPYRYVDHTHADAVVTITNTKNGQERIQEIYGQTVIIIPYVMPGFDLAKICAQLFSEQCTDQTIGMVLMNHGIFSFGGNARESYERMIELVSKAEQYLQSQGAWKLKEEVENKIQDDFSKSSLYKELAEMRNALSRVSGFPMIVKTKRNSETLSFSRRDDIKTISQQGPATPDHVIRTKQLPMLGRDVDAYVNGYKEYFDQYSKKSKEDKSILDPAPRVILDNELGLCTAGRTIKDAAIVCDIYEHTMDIISRATALGGFQALSSQDIFDVEYWDLEQAKLRSGGSPPVFSGEVALVTGAASGIGKACVDSLLARGAAVIALDINPVIESMYERQDFLGVTCDVTSDQAIQAALEQGGRAFGGVDILVLNAGVFPVSCRIENMELDDWQKTMQLNLDSNMLLMRELYPLLKLAPTPNGGRVVVIGSKNVPAPGPGAGAYSASKAALNQLVRVAALEWGQDNIRINTLHPNAVFDTAIWTEEVLQSRADSYGLSVEEYKKNNVLKVEITSHDVAELAAEMCGPLFAKTTAAQVPVDGGNERVI